MRTLAYDLALIAFGSAIPLVVAFIFFRMGGVL